MSSIDELVSQIPIGQVASQLGVDEAQAEQAVRYALPALVSGMAANAGDPAGAASLNEALGQHIDDAADGGVDIGQVDTTDGEKIVHHVFGDNEGAVVNQLGEITRRMDHPPLPDSCTAARAEPCRCSAV